MQFLLMFIVLSIINVVFSTIRTLTTVKSGKTVASLISGGYFAFYNIMLVYTVAEFPMWQKCLITFICNVLGVWIVKVIEEKIQKEQLWKIEATVDSDYIDNISSLLTNAQISYNYLTNVPNKAIFNCYCNTKQQSKALKEILKQYNAKYFVSETKIL